MIEEAYVSFEIAKLLKEKGFNEGCSFVVNATSKGVMPVSWPTTNSDIEDEKVNLIALPTQQMAMRWLREAHKIYVNILYSKFLYGNEPFYWSIERLNEKIVDERIVKTSTATEEYTYRTYEQAVEAAIRYSLKNLI